MTTPATERIIRVAHPSYVRKGNIHSTRLLWEFQVNGECVDLSSSKSRLVARHPNTEVAR